MARVSKKVSAAQREAENTPHRIWKTAIYARLSDFDDVLRDTESLEVQISYIKEYINHRDDLMLLDVFADKRCTGMNFDRPEFERLLKALQERKVNCIVVKDFSRLGRNFVETGQYLEQVFPLFGVRFIAINDNYDSLNRQSRDGMLVPIKSMINEMYSKDLSQKVQSCFRSKEARGEIYTPVPFGYKRNQQNHLIKSKTVLRLRQKTSAFPFLPTRAFDGWNAGRSFLKNNSRTPNLNLIQSNRKLPTGLSIFLKKAI